MRLAFVVQEFPLLSHTFVLSQVLHFARAGHDVSVLCRDKGDWGALNEDARDTLRRVKIEPGWFKLPDWMKALPKGMGPNLRARWERAAFQHLRADCFIAHFGYRGRHVARVKAATGDKRPLITIYHGRDVSREWELNKLSRYQELFHEGDLHLTVNANFAARLVEGGAPPSRVRTHHLGVPVKTYPFTLRPVGHPIRIVSISRLVEKKGLSTAIDAVAKLRDQRPDLDVRYDIAGEGPLHAELAAKVDRLRLGDVVRFIGPVPHEDALNRIAAADVFALPSVTAADGDKEGIPVTLMEAMALGTPVCTTRHSGIPELVEHGKTGLLADEYDHDGLSHNIEAIATGDVDVAQMARRARMFVEQHFDEDRQNAILLQACEALAAERRPAHAEHP